MDHIDRKIIDLLQNNARAPLKEIADHVFCPARRVGPHGPSGKLRHHHRLPGTGRCAEAGLHGQRRSSIWTWTPSVSRSFTPISRAAPCGGMQLRHRRLQYADRGAVRYDTGAGSVHQSPAAVWPHPDADRLFDSRGAPRRARSRAGGEAIKTKSLPPSGKVAERSEVG